MSGEAPKLYRVMTKPGSPLLFDPAAAVRDATNGRDGLVNLYMIEHDPIYSPSRDPVGWRPVGSHYFRSAGDGQYSYRSSTGGLTPPDLGDLEVPF